MNTYLCLSRYTRSTRCGSTISNVSAFER